MEAFEIFRFIVNEYRPSSDSEGWPLGLKYEYAMSAIRSIEQIGQIFIDTHNIEDARNALALGNSWGSSKCAYLLGKIYEEESDICNAYNCYVHAATLSDNPFYAEEARRLQPKDFE